MQAPRIETQTLPPPPGIVGSLRTGFDTIAGHVTVILMPLALDLVLWLAPRLGVVRLAQDFIQQLGTLYISAGIKPADIQSTLETYTKTLQTSNLQAYNLLGLLRTFPIGVSSLMSGVLPTETPWGASGVWQVDSLLQLLGLGFGLVFVGWVFGGLYFLWVGTLATPGALPEARTPIGRALVQTIVYALIWTVVALIVGLPVGLLLYVLFMVNSILGEGVLLLLGFLSMWLVVPLFFSPHGIYVRNQNAIASVMSGFQMTRFTLPTSSLFVLTVLLLGVGLNQLWMQPRDNSWLMLVGIFGHAFITTALLASSFVYYDNMSSWLQVALARLHAGLPGQNS